MSLGFDEVQLPIKVWGRDSWRYEGDVYVLNNRCGKGERLSCMDCSHIVTREQVPSQ